MLNSIQSQNNARPAFGCSTCRPGLLAIGELVKHGVKRADAVEFFDRFAPRSGSIKVDFGTVDGEHGLLTNLATKAAMTMLRIMGK